MNDMPHPPPGVKGLRFAAVPAGRAAPALDPGLRARPQRDQPGDASVAWSTREVVCHPSPTGSDHWQDRGQLGRAAPPTIPVRDSKAVKPKGGRFSEGRAESDEDAPPH
jgi:hypothetical protein